MVKGGLRKASETRFIKPCCAGVWGQDKANDHRRGEAPGLERQRQEVAQ